MGLKLQLIDVRSINSVIGDNFPGAFAPLQQGNDLLPNSSNDSLRFSSTLGAHFGKNLSQPDFETPSVFPNAPNIGMSSALPQLFIGFSATTPRMAETIPSTAATDLRKPNMSNLSGSAGLVAPKTSVSNHASIAQRSIIKRSGQPSSSYQKREPSLHPLDGSGSGAARAVDLTSRKQESPSAETIFDTSREAHRPYI